jgi:light-regulated signal transduction histidine kinase (bacteriophytochrome)
VDLDKVIKNIETDLEVIIQEKHAIIHYKDLPALEGSPILIYQLFYNLVNNSLKFAKAGEAPEVSITSKAIYPEGKGFTQIVIRDNGIGFEQEQAEKIFNTFARLNSKDNYEGTGLGLALCKKIVERHHGTIEATGEINKGATFTITLPLKQKEFNFNTIPNL